MRIILTNHLAQQKQLSAPKQQIPHKFFFETLVKSIKHSPNTQLLFKMNDRE